MFRSLLFNVFVAKKSVMAPFSDRLSVNRCRPWQPPANGAPNRQRHAKAVYRSANMTSRALAGRGYAPVEAR